MKESKFIELLNLYVDQEISQPDAALLEQEISSNPERRKVYLQYCRMHRASTVLFESFKAGSVPAGKVLAEAAKKVDDKVILFPSQTHTRSWRWAYAGGLVAAAACFVVVLVRNDSTPAAGNAMATMRIPRASTQLVPTGPEAQYASAKTPVNKAPEYRPVFVAQKITPNDYSAESQSDVFNNQLALDWMKDVQFQPVKALSTDDISFDTKPTLKQDPRSFTGKRPVQAQAEMTAFQFQK